MFRFLRNLLFGSGDQSGSQSEQTIEDLRRENARLRQENQQLRNPTNVNIHFEPVTSRPSNFINSIHKAVLKENLPSVQYLIEMNDVDVNARDPSFFAHHQTPLHYACGKGNLRICQYLISRGASLLLRTDGIITAYQTPFHEACRNGNLEVIRFLISCGANVEIEDRFHKTPIFYAIESKKLETVRMLVEEYHVNTEKNSIDGTPFLYAVKENLIDIARYFVESCHANIHAVDSSRRNAILLAYKADPQLFQYLIGLGINPRAKDMRREGLVHILCDHSRMNLLTYAVETLHLPVNDKNEDGETPLHLAAKNGSAEVIMYLLAHGADRTIRNNKRQTPRDVAKPEVQSYL